MHPYLIKTHHPMSLLVLGPSKIFYLKNQKKNKKQKQNKKSHTSLGKKKKNKKHLLGAM